MAFDALQRERASVPVELSGCARSSRHWVCDSLAPPKKENNVAEAEQFAGCAIVISHDRWFLDRVATHILAFEGDSKVTFFDGNFSEYEDWRKQQLGDAATRPHRITYRKLTR